MPPKRTSSTTPAAKRRRIALPYNPRSVSYSPQDAYKHFIQNHVVGKPKFNGKISVKDTDIPPGWTTFYPSDPQHLIAGEIAHKFNKETASSPLGGIHSVAPRTTDGTMYWGTKDKDTIQPTLFLNKKRPLPAPNILAHELIHANDHQVDFLNPKVWGDIVDLAKAERLTKIDDVGSKLGLQSSLKPVQDIVDPKKNFSTEYPFSSLKIEGEDTRDRFGGKVDGMLAAEERRTPHGVGVAYDIPTNSSGDVDWDQLNLDLQKYTNTNDPLALYGPDPQKVPNMFFDVNLASEFPAFISENLTNQWHANHSAAGATSLNSNQAHFLYKTLGHMENAYPVREYPTMGKYIQARRNSLYNRYKPSTGGAHPFGDKPFFKEAAADSNVKYFGKP